MKSVSTAEILNEIEKLTKDYFFSQPKDSFIPGKSRIDLAAPSYGWEEACEAIDSILSTWVTMGEKVKEFESLFAQYLGVPHAIMVNSGSSANLLTLSILANPMTGNRIEPGDEVITPAVTWATTIYPIIQVGAVPVLVDVDLDTFNISVPEIEKAITERTKAIMLVHLLGNPCDIQVIMDLARRHNLFVVEDTCESYGAQVGEQKVGSFGDLATVSFYVTHHITTIEGGMILTSNEEYAERARAMRAFGWIRDLRDRDKIAEGYKEIHPNFLFINTGYNVRPTEIQGAFGIHQMKKLEKLIEIRKDNARYWTESLRKFSNYLLLQVERPGTRHVWHHYPVTVRPEAPFTRKELVDFLEGKGLETRPIVTGNMDEQPVMRLLNYRKVGDLPNARLIHHQSFMFGVHQGIGIEEREAVVGYFDEFMARFL